MRIQVRGLVTTSLMLSKLVFLLTGNFTGKWKYCVKTDMKGTEREKWTICGKEGKH